MKRGFVIAGIFVIFLSYFVVSQSVGQFTIGNEAPTIQSGSFGVQDSANGFDAINLDTHDLTPSFEWVVNDNNPDTLSSSICIGTATGLCDVLAETIIGSTFISGNLVSYEYTGTGIGFNQGSDCNANTCSKDYIVKLIANDGQDSYSEEFIVSFLNDVPNTPSGLTPSETHDQTPSLSWTATDGDDGSVNKWPMDTLTYHIQIGDIAGGEEYLADPFGLTPSASAGNPIPWGTPGSTEARNTVQVRIWSTDNTGINSAFYDTTLDLVDNLPELMNIYMSDNVIDELTASCIDFLQPCNINPLAGNYTSVNILLRINDTDEDCSLSTHSANAVLCKVVDGSLDVCDDLTNADYPYTLDFVSANGNECDFSISVPAGDPNGIEFFLAPNNYKMFLKASSQAGASTTPIDQVRWTFSSILAFDYPSSVFLGDRQAEGGDGIQLGQSNPGLPIATMTNYGNNVIGIEWEATDPSSDASTCNGNTATCWDLSTAPDLQIDDDTSSGEPVETLLTSVNVPEGPARVSFEPAGGLQICNAFACNSGTGEKLNTAFHVTPPVGLSAGDYQTTFTITIS